MRITRRHALLSGAMALTLPAVPAAGKSAQTAPETSLEADAALLQAIDRVNACHTAYDEAERAHEQARAALPTWIRISQDAGCMGRPDELGQRLRDAYAATPAKATLERCTEAGDALCDAEMTALRTPAHTLYGAYAKAALVALPLAKALDNPEDDPFCPEALVKTLRDDIERLFFAGGRPA